MANIVMKPWTKAQRFFQEVVQEAKKVIWPTWRDVMVTSILVLILSAMCAVFLFFVDQLVLLALQHIMGGGVVGV